MASLPLFDFKFRLNLNGATDVRMIVRDVAIGLEMSECKERPPYWTLKPNGKPAMKLKTAFFFAAIFSSGPGLALAAPGPKEACQAIAEQAREAVAMKKQGLAVDKAVAQLAAKPVPDSIPSAQHGFYKSKLPGALRFAYMGGMSGDGTAAFYLKQCLQGS